MKGAVSFHGSLLSGFLPSYNRRMRTEIRQILVFLAFGAGVFLGFFAVDYSAAPATLVCVCSLAFAVAHRRTSPTTTATSPELATLPASRDDRFIFRINAAFAARQRASDDSAGPTFSDVEHHGQRR
jgi:hypothetical protein